VVREIFLVKTQNNITKVTTVFKDISRGFAPEDGKAGMVQSLEKLTGTIK